MSTNYIREAVRQMKGLPEPKNADSERELDLHMAKELLSATYSIHRMRYKGCEDCTAAIIEVRTALESLVDTLAEEIEEIEEMRAFSGLVPPC